MQPQEKAGGGLASSASSPEMLWNGLWLKQGAAGRDLCWFDVLWLQPFLISNFG